LLPYKNTIIEEKIALTLSARKEGVMCSASENQNFSSVFAEDLSLLPAIMAALTAPIEVPATISNSIPYFSRVL
jgi:hypothetical protein